MKNQKSKQILTSPTISLNSRADTYWRANGFDDYLSFIRPKLQLPNSLSFSSNPNLLQDKFGIKDIGFGNWVTNEDRFNYMNGLIVALYDLNKVLSFDLYLGLGELSVGFGARGVGRALAHYEPLSKIINITRYHRGDEPKLARFVATGGMGSFAHEYGHFLDYIGGEYIEPSNSIFSLTGGHSTDTGRLPCGTNQHLRKITNDILEKIFWKVPYKKQSGYYIRLLAAIDRDTEKGEYFIRRNELFARWFEAYIFQKLNSFGIVNHLLSKTKYDPRIYPTISELQPIIPLFDKFCLYFKKGYFI
ncbi:LPD1 domain-containing protein [Emticicia sp. W12TSBA100-4]|uniref:LPD1 domain-containing protein n=1 Tax=Emticicia sp. W12TSBA100-4 TaxID=3160965 RepID=UPI003305901A